MGRAFSTSYLAGEPLANDFFAPTFLDAGARAARTRAAAKQRVSSELLKVLSDQQAELPLSPARQESWQALADGDAAAVITGQQVGLFLGPLYAFYKAASAIAVARALRAESGVRCVPIFWLQTEDHDFAEIRSATVADGQGMPIRLELADELGDLGRISVAHRKLPAQVDELTHRLAQALGEGQAAREVVGLVRESYRPGVGVAAAFAGLLARVFADEGLLIFDPRDARVARLTAPSIRAFIEDAVEVEAALHRGEAALRSAGFAVQVPIREQGALVFFHRDGVEGPRHRIRRHKSEPTWRLSGSTEAIAHDDLLATLAQDPLRFSTSALLRPIVQDTLFPTAAYVGGPGEISYFAQLGPLYARANLSPPLLVPRGRFCVVDARARRRLGQLGLSVRDLAAQEHSLRARLQGGLPEGAVSVEELRRRVAGEILPAVDQVASAVDRAGVSLHRAAERTRKSVAHALDRLVDRYARVLLERDGVTTRRLRDLELALAPEGIPQERFYAWPSLAGRIGAQAFKDMVMQRLGANPFATEICELHP